MVSIVRSYISCFREGESSEAECYKLREHAKGMKYIGNIDKVIETLATNVVFVCNTDRC